MTSQGTNGHVTTRGTGSEERTADEVGLFRPAHVRGAVPLGRSASAAALAAAATAYWGDSQHMSPGKRRREFWSPALPKKQQLATKAYVKRCMRNQLEHKEICVTSIVGNSGVPTTAGRVDPIQTYNVIQGTTDDTRLGNFIKREKLVCRLRFGTVAGAQDTSFRAILVYDKQTNGATPAITDILTTGTGGLYSGYNGDNVIGYGGSRFRILRDTQPFVINSEPYGVVGTVSSFTRAHAVTWTLTKELGEVQFDASAGAIGDIVSGEIFLVTISDGNTATVQATVQTRYTDE